MGNLPVTTGPKSEAPFPSSFQGEQHLSKAEHGSPASLSSSLIQSFGHVLQGMPGGEKGTLSKRERELLARAEFSGTVSDGKSALRNRKKIIFGSFNPCYCHHHHYYYYVYEHFVFMYVCIPCVYLVLPCPDEVRFPRTGVIDGCEPSSVSGLGGSTHTVRVMVEVAFVRSYLCALWYGMKSDLVMPPALFFLSCST
ncbi:hypothetical protein STEG23_033224, partial [Scotinomys teguina]